MIFKIIVAIITWSALCFSVAQAQIQPEIAWEEPGQISEKTRSILLSLNAGGALVGHADLGKESPFAEKSEEELIIIMKSSNYSWTGWKLKVFKKPEKNVYYSRGRREKDKYYLVLDELVAPYTGKKIFKRHIQLGNTYTSGMLDIFLLREYLNIGGTGSDHYYLWAHFIWNKYANEYRKKGGFLDEGYTLKELKNIYPDVYKKIMLEEKKRELEEEKKRQAVEDLKKAAAAAVKKRELEKMRKQEEYNRQLEKERQLEEEKRKQAEKRKQEEKHRLEEEKRKLQEKIRALNDKIDSYPFWSFDKKYETYKELSILVPANNHYEFMTLIFHPQTRKVSFIIVNGVLIVIIIIVLWRRSPKYKMRKEEKLCKKEEQIIERQKALEMEKEAHEMQRKIEEEQRLYEEQNRREVQRRRFEHKKIRKEIWDRNWGKCELCGRRTSSIDDGYFSAITEDGCIFDGEHYVKEELLLCHLCFQECYDRGVVTENAELYRRKGIDFRDESHPRHITPEIRQKVWYRDGGKCQMCGSNENLQYDHIIPFSKGGSNTEDNIQLLCAECNKLKLDII